MDHYTVYNINWDTDRQKICLPNIMRICVPEWVDDVEEYLSDHISDETGYLHNGFLYEKEE